MLLVHVPKFSRLPGKQTGGTCIIQTQELSLININKRAAGRIIIITIKSALFHVYIELPSCDTTTTTVLDVNTRPLLLDRILFNKYLYFCKRTTDLTKRLQITSRFFFIVPPPHTHINIFDHF